MTTQPTHWIAGTGQIIPVVIVEAGTGGHSPKFVPPDPVVVRSVEDYFEFVASEKCLFTDRTSAIVEARRLREEELRAARLALARIERQELLNGTSLFPAALSIPLKDGSDTQVPVVEITAESSASDTPVPAEDVVPKKKVQDVAAKPRTLLERVIYVIGRDTISFDEICQRLQKRHWFPKLRSSVSNVLSAHKNLFNCPTRGMYSLRTKPKANPIDDAVTDNSEADEAASAEVDASDEDGEAEDEDDEDDDESEADEEDGETDLQEALAAVSDDGEEASEDQSAVSDEPPSEFAIWMNKPMRELTPEHAHFRDDDVVLSERLNNGTWTVEIYVTGLELWSEGNSGDRSQAREVAENNLRTKVRNLSRIVEDLGI